jgi:hypothetical protein
VSKQPYTILANMPSQDLPMDPDNDWHTGGGQEVPASRAVRQQQQAHAEHEVQQVRRQ